MVTLYNIIYLNRPNIVRRIQFLKTKLYVALYYFFFFYLLLLFNCSVTFLDSEEFQRVEIKNI